MAPGWWGEFLEEILPTKWMRRIAAMTVTLGLGAPFLYDGLLKIELKIEWLAAPAVRLSLALFVFCVGLFSLLILSLRFIHEVQEKAKNTTAKPPKAAVVIPDKFDELTEKCIFTIGNYPNKTSKEIGMAIEENDQLILHTLEKLQGFDLVDCSYSYRGQHWYPTARGREFMAKNKMFIKPKR